ncbi:MAG: hypothetical protein ACREMO_07700 [Gemmatimonadales bacterium]
MSPDRIERRREFARRARAFYDDKLARSEVLADVIPEDYADPVLAPLLAAVQNQPKKSRFSGLWGRPYEATVTRARTLIEAAER